MNAAPEPALLTTSAPVPIDRPFTTAWAKANDVSSRRLRDWLCRGLLRSPVHGVLHATQLADSLELRLDCLRLVVPDHAVVTDRTAAWLHGAPMVLAPGAHLGVPVVDLYLLPGGRLRRGVVRSGQRELFAAEVQEIGGLRVTTRMRTMCDLGRNLPRKPAFGAMCMLLKVCDFTVTDIRFQADGRFRGHRWVRQLRSLLPALDRRFESPGEAMLALIWHDTPGMPQFEPQWKVPGPVGSYYLDFAVPELGYAAEYDGVEFHGPDRAEADHERRTWLKRSQGWTFGVFGAADVRGDGKAASDRLLADVVAARRTLAARRVVI